MKIEIKDELQDQLEEYKRGNQALLIEKAKLQSDLNTTLSMLRFTLGIAYNAHPDNRQIRGMVEKLWVLEGDN